MPVHTGKDSKGCFAQWGGQKKYYYTCGDKQARKRAEAKAAAQGKAAHASGYTGNEAMPHNFEYVTTNIKPVIRHDMMEGRDWVVAPTQMITEGVHNGSDGPIYYPAEELAKLPASWNHKPVVVYHPEVNGESVSACDPIQLTTRKVGIMLNTKWDGDTKKLGTETWLDPLRMGVVDNRVAEAIENNEMMEVSTGLFMDLDKEEGEWNGEAYTGVARNLQPDHLALLPDKKGACSIEDGAGFLRVNEESGTITCKTMEGDVETVAINEKKGIKALASSNKVEAILFDKDKWTDKEAKKWVKLRKNVKSVNALVMNEMSFSDKESMLRSSLYSTKDDVWMVETFETYLIYEQEGRLYKQDYSINDGVVSFEGLPKLVEKKVTYTEVLTNANDKKVKGNTMDKKQIVDVLIENENTSWTEEHRETLMGLEIDVLTNMQADITTLSEKASQKKDEPVDNEKGTQVVGNTEPTEKKPQTLNEYVGNAPPEIREMLVSGLSTLADRRMRLIEVIKANERNVFTDDELKDMKIDMLQSLATLAAKETEEQSDPNIVPLFSGQRDVVGNSQGVVPEPLLLPTMNFDTKTA